MPFSITIPEKSYPLYILMIKYSDDQKETIQEIYKKIKIPNDISCIDENIKEFGDINAFRPVIKELLTLFSVFNNLKEEKGLTLEEFAELVHDAISEELAIKDSRLYEEIKTSMEEFEQFIIKVFKSNESLIMYEKAKNLLRERENLLINSRILTDLRPVFDENSVRTFSRGIILHTLRIELSNKARDLEKIYIGLDYKDLIKLKDDIERAMQKEEKIKEKCSESKIILLGE